ncbi:MAG: hypothetical protein R3Y24_04270 [Eubacteriales bacterium]
MKDKKKKWVIGTIIGTIGILFSIALAMVIVDPYFHFHKPLSGISYALNNERYMNDGIVKNFEYDAIITGSSMNQNFKTTTLDRLFGTTSVKTTFSGAGFQEIADNLQRACDSKNDVEMVVWGLDFNGLRREHDWQGYTGYPDYLYDTNVWNDSSYVWNKSILLSGLLNTIIDTLQGQESTTFDEYSSWEHETGLDAISNTYVRSEEMAEEQMVLTDSEIQMVTDNIANNIVAIANNNPDTTFYLFYTPYSALYWESLYRAGELEKQIEAETIATELMLTCENIKLYNFSKETDITEDLSYYRDKEHYSAEINEVILQWIKDDVGLVTVENYQETIDWEQEYYMTYDYDGLYAKYQ